MKINIINNHLYTVQPQHWMLIPTII